MLRAIQEKCSWAKTLELRGAEPVSSHPLMHPVATARKKKISLGSKYYAQQEHPVNEGRKKMHINKPNRNSAICLLGCALVFLLSGSALSQTSSDGGGTGSASHAGGATSGNWGAGAASEAAQAGAGGTGSFNATALGGIVAGAVAVLAAIALASSGDNSPTPTTSHHGP